MAPLSLAFARTYLSSVVASISVRSRSRRQTMAIILCLVSAVAMLAFKPSAICPGAGCAAQAPAADLRAAAPSAHSEPARQAHRSIQRTPVQPASEFPSAQWVTAPLVKSGKQPLAMLVHIPKTGGSSLEAWALQQGWQWGMHMSEPELKPGAPGWSGTTTGHVWRLCHSWHIPPKYFVGVRSDTPMLAVFRDPYRRAISQALYKSVPCEKKAINRYLTRMLKHNYNATSGTAHANADCHWLPQTEYLIDEDGRWFTNLKVVRTKSLGDDMSEVFGDLYGGKSGTLKHKLSHQSCRAKQSWLTDSVRKKLELVYRSDLEFMSALNMGAGREVGD